MVNKDSLLSSYKYNLPENLIAQQPSIPAHNAKMMVIFPEKWKTKIEHSTFIELPKDINNHYLIFLNRTKVFKARIPLQGEKIIRKSWKEVIIDSWEIFVYRIITEKTFECLVSDSKNFKPWSKIFFKDSTILESKEFTENWILFEISNQSIFSFLEKIWEMPLPPYIKYEKEKEQRYQTFFAEEIGSAAAPTASLHFTPELIKQLEDKKVELKYLCLHVGLWTFKPVYEENIENQKLHFEPMIIPNNIREFIKEKKEEKKIFLPVGTTMIRYLESLPYIRKYLRNINYFKDINSEVIKRWDSLTESITINKVNEFIPEQEIQITNDWNLIVQTRLFIRPWIPFLIVDELITNFHLPKSSLMMLISAFIWRENLLNAYQEAIKNWYKFYSFWDWMRIKWKIN